MLTQEAFLAFYPQFRSFTPSVVLPDILSRANARFSDFGKDAEEARRLFTAHHLTMYAMTALPSTAPPGTPTSEVISSAGRAEGASRIASKRVGEVQVTYASSSLSSSSSSGALASLNETAYGRQLLVLMSLYSHPRYIP